MSGDLGQFDENGALHIVGRKKDLIIRGGHNIYPATIEELAQRHPAILKVAAYPVDHERLGEQVCLAVITRDGTEVTAQEMLAHLLEFGLSKYDLPEHFIAMSSFPMTASGKILKRELVELTRAGKLVPQAVRTGASATPNMERKAI